MLFLQCLLQLQREVNPKTSHSFNEKTDGTVSISGPYRLCFLGHHLWLSFWCWMHLRSQPMCTFSYCSVKQCSRDEMGECVASFPGGLRVHSYWKNHLCSLPQMKWAPVPSDSPGRENEVGQIPNMTDYCPQHLPCSYLQQYQASSLIRTDQCVWGL